MRTARSDTPTSANTASHKEAIIVICTDADKTREMFEILLGDNLKSRKEFIEENGYLYIVMAETG
ncbi:MAG: hypothetical protein FWE90_00230 [Defluviitaleaceae bacterium]|nr:hypothetical protein [Defluviitaleaceae bacterium]